MPMLSGPGSIAVTIGFTSLATHWLDYAAIILGILIVAVITYLTLSLSERVVHVIGANGTSSLNDKLKSDVSDLKSALNDAPVRDLRKAIGVNDRYVFINQLFRGDEVMYERSLKTICGLRTISMALDANQK